MLFTPENTTFVVLSFEGPDVYSQAGGLGVRAKELVRALAQSGFPTHLFFVGDPSLPGEESLVDGKLTYHRWGQWLSAAFPGGVYEGEDDKVRDWNLSVPEYVAEKIVVPAAKDGVVVVMGEEWHTAWSMNRLSDVLYYNGVRDRTILLWNANNIFSFDRINWGALAYVSTITTVSRYMKHYMWDLGLNPIVIPNGIPREAIVDAPRGDVQALRLAAGADLFLFKIGRFDPDKRWLMAMSAVVALKREGLRVKLLIRGGREPHGGEVLNFARQSGLRVDDVRSPQDAQELQKVLNQHQEADVVNFTSFLPESLLGTIYSAVDAVLANSGHEPFGLVGLEVMAAGGLAVTGSTGEDYAEPYRNALVLETDDALELVTNLRLIRDNPGLAKRIREQGRQTARDYTWEKVIDQMQYRIELAGRQQNVRLPKSRPARRRKVASPELAGSAAAS